MRTMEEVNRVLNYTIDIPINRIEEICQAEKEGRLRMIREAPTADVKEIVRGKWKLYGNDDDCGMTYYCSYCGFHLSDDLFYRGYENGKWIENNVFKFCPNCGADMRGDTE